MGRKRKTNKHLPERVYIRRGTYFWFPPPNTARQLGKTAVRLGHTLPEAMLAWADLVQPQIESATVGDLIDRYLCEIAPKKAPRTYRDNLREVQPLRAFFGDMRPQDVTPVHVYKYLDTRGAPVRANREKALLSHIYTMAIRWGVVRDNPCRGVKRNPERPRDRYIEDWEFQAVRGRGSALVQGMMDLAYLTGLREGDLLRIKLQDLRDDGLYVEIGKSRRYNGTTKRWLFEWTPTLKEVIERIRTMRRPLRRTHLFCTRKGRPYTTDGFASIWQRTMRKALEEDTIKERFRFHDIRRKAATDAEKAQGREFARRLLAHDDQRTTGIYVSGIQRVTPLK